MHTFAFHKKVVDLLGGYHKSTFQNNLDSQFLSLSQEGGRASTLNATQERLAVAEFADKMQQAAGPGLGFEGGHLPYP